MWLLAVCWWYVLCKKLLMTSHVVTVKNSRFRVIFVCVNATVTQPRDAACRASWINDRPNSGNLMIPRYVQRTMLKCCQPSKMHKMSFGLCCCENPLFVLNSNTATQNLWIAEITYRNICATQKQTFKGFRATLIWKPAIVDGVSCIYL